MPALPDIRGIVGALAGAAMLAACSTGTPTGSESTTDSSSTETSSTSASPSAGLAEVTVTVPDGMDEAPFDEARRALVPAGWTLSVWARTPKPRLAAWAPDGAMLVSIPSAGQVLSMRPDRTDVLLDGLNQPHGLAFAGNTLYIAESDGVGAYEYRAGAAADRRTIADGLPDARSPDLRGAYSHALKSVAVDPEGDVYFSIGSTGNVSAEDRTATPPR
ncbi:MAG: hypothetical protein ACSLE3_13490, partial [Microbacteriaceae bacterium]